MLVKYETKGIFIHFDSKTENKVVDSIYPLLSNPYHRSTLTHSYEHTRTTPPAYQHAPRHLLRDQRLKIHIYIGFI